MNKKGFAATGILYTILVLFILLIFGMITMLYSRNNILNRIQQEIKGNLSYINDVYANGTAVYYNPGTNTKCTETDYNNNADKLGKTGCMKWYAIENSDSNKSTVDVILDHNTTATVAWNSSGNSADGMNEVAESLANDTSTWTSGLNARLITADEVAKITGNTTFSSETSTYSDWFYFDSNSQTQTANAQRASNYAWLYDYTSGCTSYGCNVADSSTYGYWTSTPVAGDTYDAWSVFRNGDLKNIFVDNTSFNGVRPVITISKEIIK